MGQFQTNALHKASVFLGSDIHQADKLRLDAGEATREIARTFNVNHRTISRLVL